VNFEKIDLVSLMTQGLGEFEDKIQASALDFRISSDAKVIINADGKLLWRAIENLLLNIFKYALAGSRVYINIIELGHVVILTIKNISAEEIIIFPLVIHFSVFWFCAGILAILLRVYYCCVRCSSLVCLGVLCQFDLFLFGG
jgi:hypothetical protein